MQGIYTGGGTSRPKTKKALKEAIAADPSSVIFEPTSIFNTEYGGSVAEMPEVDPIVVVGPKPYDRRWYATITRIGEKVRVT